MVAYTFSKLPTANFNTTPASIARSATGSVYDIGDTGFLTPLNMTLVVGGAVVTTISSDALGFLPDFRLDGRTSCVWKQTGTPFATVLTTTDPVPGPAGPPGPSGVAAWAANTAYTAGQPVVSPSGDVVTAKNTFTSGATYDASNWSLSSSYATPAQAAGLSAALSIVFGG